MHQADRHNHGPYLADISGGWQGQSYAVSDQRVFQQIDNIYSCESSDEDQLQRMSENRKLIADQHWALHGEWQRWYQWACGIEPPAAHTGGGNSGGGDVSGGDDTGGGDISGGGDTGSGDVYGGGDTGGGDIYGGGNTGGGDVYGGGDSGGGDDTGGADNFGDGDTVGGYAPPVQWPTVHNTGPPVSTYYQGLANIEAMMGWGLQFVSLQSIDAIYWNLGDVTVNAFWRRGHRGMELSFRGLFGVHKEEEWTGSDALFDLGTSLRTWWRWGGVGLFASGKLMNFHESFKDEVGDRFRLAPEAFVTLGSLDRKWSSLVAILRWDLAQDLNPFRWLVVEGRYFLFWGRYERQVGVDGDGGIDMISFGLRIAG